MMRIERIVRAGSGQRRQSGWNWRFGDVCASASLESVGSPHFWEP